MLPFKGRGQKRSPSNRIRVGTIAVVVIALSYFAVTTSNPNDAGQLEVVAYTFRLCTEPPHSNCVIDGDTFYLENQSIRVADIDAPETSRPKCAREAQLGEEATARFLELLNADEFQLNRYDNRDTEQYGRLLRTVTTRGLSLGAVLVAEGLAREWGGSNVDWCRGKSGLVRVVKASEVVSSCEANSRYGRRHRVPKA